MTIQVTEAEAAMTAAVDHYLSNSEINASGVRIIPKKVFMDAMAKHDVTEADIKKIQDATNFETTVAARVALADTENKIAAASDADRGNEEWRKACSSMVRLPTHGGNTEVEFFAEKHANVPARGENPASVKISHGVVRTKIVTKGRIEKSFHDEAEKRVLASLGIES